MKKKFVYCLILAIAIILQTSVFPLLFSSRFMGDEMLMLILAWSLIEGFANFLYWAIFAGIVFDFISYSSIGTHALIFILVVYFVSFFSKRFTVELKGSGFGVIGLFVVFSTFISRAIIAFEFFDKNKNFYGYWNMFGGVGEFSVHLLINTILFACWFGIINRSKDFFKIA